MTLGRGLVTVGAWRRSGTAQMRLFSGVIAYIMQMIAFVRLRSRFLSMERPFVSPFGNTGATVAAAIALCARFVLFLNPDYRFGVYGCEARDAAGLLYYRPIGRKKLINSPEEESAAKHSPQTST